MRSTMTCSLPRAVWPPGVGKLGQLGVWSAVVALTLSVTAAHGGVITTGSLDSGTGGTPDLSPGNKLLWTTTTQDDSWYSVDVFSLPRQDPGDFTFQLPNQFQSFRQRQASQTQAASTSEVSAGSPTSGGQTTEIDVVSSGSTGTTGSDGVVTQPAEQRDQVAVPGVARLSGLSVGSGGTDTTKSGPTDGGDAGGSKDGSGDTAGDGKPTTSGGDGGDTKPPPGSLPGDPLDPGAVGLGDNPAKPTVSDSTPAFTGSSSSTPQVTSSNPEPPTIVLMGIGGLALGWLARRYRQLRQLAAA